MIVDYKTVIKDLVSNICPRGSVGVEIGTRKGYSAETILQCENVSKVYLVDPYKSFLKDKSQHAFDRYLKRAARRLSKFGDRATFVRQTSMDAIPIVNEQLDFVYIDGNHEYSFVKNDVNEWANKLKSGSLCFGHDWVDESHMDFDSLGGVRQAILEFVDERGEEIEKEHTGCCEIKHASIEGGLYLSPPIDYGVCIWWFVKK